MNKPLSKDESKLLRISPVTTVDVNITIVGLSPLIQHAWSAKAKKMLDHTTEKPKKAAKKPPIVPEDEFEGALYRTEDGDYGVPAMAIKKAITEATHHDIGLAKTLVRKAVFIVCSDANGCLPLQCDPPRMREDLVRIGTKKTAQIRYRPEFINWAVMVPMKIDTGLISVEEVVNMLNRAGFGVGIGEWRPQHNGDFGRFCVKTD